VCESWAYLFLPRENNSILDEEKEESLTRKRIHVKERVKGTDNVGGGQERTTCSCSEEFCLNSEPVFRMK